MSDLDLMIACTSLKRAVLGTLSDPVNDPDKGCGDAVVQVGAALATLKPNEEMILTMRFGINRPQKMTLVDIGERLNISKDRVRFMEARAIRKLRHYTRKSIWQMTV